MSYIDFVYGKFARIKSRFVWKTVGKVVGLDSKKPDLIIEDSEISMAGMAKKLNVTSRTVEREVRKLRESGRIERVGGRRFGRWEIKETCD